MAKKSKDKQIHPDANARSASTSSKNSSKKPAKSAAPLPTPREDDFIVFTNSKSEPNRKKGHDSSAGKGDSAGSSAASVMPAEGGPPKPTARQLVGGASWTGKLPLNLFSEHCQKQKWLPPNYENVTKRDELFSCVVSLSKRDPKTQEMVKLPPFRLPPSHVHLVQKPTAVEARNATATYGLHRVCSGKNLSMALPPDYRSLWKEFDALKAEDLKRDKENVHLYSADPFATLKAREEAKAALEKKRKQQEAIKEKARAMPGSSGLVLRSKAMEGLQGGQADPMRGWTNIPRIDIGRKLRAQLEDCVRRNATWNPHGLKIPKMEQERILRELTNAGFRESHVTEAVQECRDREETLEWLLIHVPEDDLPSWALPERYSAGAEVAATSDLRREAAIQRLQRSGYTMELVRKMYEEHGDEDLAADALQDALFTDDSTGVESVADEAIDNWDDEMESLEAVYGDAFERVTKDLCQIKLADVTNVQSGVLLQIRKSRMHPRGLTLFLLAPDLPSQIKLSIIRATLSHIRESLAGEAMKCLLVFDWVQHNINEVINNPGNLREISGVVCNASQVRGDKPKARIAKYPRPKPIDWTPNPSSNSPWLEKLETPAMKRMLTERMKLPAWEMRNTIVDTISANDVTIVAGETGSGKSTQTLQFVLDHMYSQGLGGSAKIFCTQPRRVAAIGLADRVSAERCSEVGQEVGYMIRGDNKVTKDTKITFMTTGVLLRRMSSGASPEEALADVSVIALDEVHERSLDTDLLLAMLREVKTRRKDLGVVLMSATLDLETFKSYYEASGLRVGVAQIPGRTFPITDFYLDEIVRMTRFSVDGRDDDLYDSTSSTDPVNKIIQQLGYGINYKLLAETTQCISEELYHQNNDGAILLFLPGVEEIKRAARAIEDLDTTSHLLVLPLHASLDIKEQRRVFQHPPKGKRKVVVSTNVAETSLTIDDIVAVLDTGKVKETVYDPQNNIRKLELVWASLASCRQRRGRAGRTQAGLCFKLFTKAMEQRLSARSEPEIRRIPLENLCLSVKAMGINDVASFLSRMPSPPEDLAVEEAIKLLRRMRALNGDELTSLGTYLSRLPTDLRAAKLMIHGAIFGCLEEAVTLAAILSSKSPFVAPAEKRELAKQARMTFHQKGDGDLETDLRAFSKWESLEREGLPQRQIRNFCAENFLSYQSLADIASTRTQFYSALAEIGILRPKDTTAASHSKRALVRALTASAFNPQVARISLPDKKYAANMKGAVELEPEAKAIKYFISGPPEKRVFIHPSSTLFDDQGFAGNSDFVSYFTLMSTSKLFIRDITPFNTFTLLLFGGPIELDTRGRGLVVDGWLKLRGWARIGVLVSKLRDLADDQIAVKIENPGVEVENSEVVRLATRLIELNGLDA